MGKLGEFCLATAAIGPAGEGGIYVLQPNDRLVTCVAPLTEYPTDSAAFALQVLGVLAQLCKGRRAQITRFWRPLDAASPSEYFPPERIGGPIADVAIPPLASDRRCEGVYVQCGQRLHLAVAPADPGETDSFPCALTVRIRLQASENYESDGGRRVGQVTQEVFQIVDQLGSCRQGFVDASWAWSVASGMLYSPFPVRPLAMRTEIELREMRMLTDERRSAVCGSYWAHYFGPSLARRLDPDRSLVERYLRVSKGRGQDSKRAVVFKSGGLFVSVSENPAECCDDVLGDPQSAWIHNALWLRQAFRSRRML